MTLRSRCWQPWVLAAALVSLAACGDSNSNGSGPAATATSMPTRATASPTVTLKPTPSPTGTPSVIPLVSGLVVLNRSIVAPAPETLGTPPKEWAAAPDGRSFDRALASADWAVDGAPDKQGSTSGDGQFDIEGLSPGPHVLKVTKTLGGNVLPIDIPFVVGDDGSASVVAEVSWGQVRVTSTYTQNGATVYEVHAPNGTSVVIQDGSVREIGDGSRTLVDADGDGQFDVTPCWPSIWNCADPSCPEGQVCVCSGSCPVCDVCGVCAPPRTAVAYACNADGMCAQPTDQCVCAASCPDCKDCTTKVCVPGCAPVTITAITVNGPTQVRISQQASMTAAATLSDGSVIDVTYLAEWTSSDESVATVDSWGTITAAGLGETAISASLGGVHSAPWPLKVVQQPALRRITVQNNSCIRPIEIMVPGGLISSSPVPPAKTDILPVPSCGQVVLVGNTIQFAAFGEFEDGSYQEITSAVDWHVDPASVGTVDHGVFTGVQPGTAQLTAALGGVVSDPTDIRVVSEPTVVAVTIYADNGGVAFAGAPVPAAAGVPCMVTPAAADMGPCCCWQNQVGIAAPCNCGYTLTLLRGDQLQFHATAQYDTGEWREVTNTVTWRSSDTAVATMDSGGVMTAVQAGDSTIDAVLGAVTSNQVDVHVVNEATLQSIYIYQEGGSGVVAKGDQRFFTATGYYDVGFSRDVTSTATWHSSDDSIGGFDSPGAFTGRSAGTVEVWAELAGQDSAHLSLEVYETSALTYCDPAQINRAVWSDDFNRVTLESDCASYTEPGLVTLRYTVTETQPHGGVFNPCLDLYVFAGKTRVRVIRQQGCGAPFVAPSAAGLDDLLKYQLRAFWDLKDDQGNPVAPGIYTIYGRFYLYYDPVVSIDVSVSSPNGPPPPTWTPTPNEGPTLTPTYPWPVCTPPLCAPGEVFFCPEKCPGGCGSVCVPANRVPLGTAEQSSTRP